MRQEKPMIESSNRAKGLFRELQAVGSQQGWFLSLIHICLCSDRPQGDFSSGITDQEGIGAAAFERGVLL